MKGAGSASERRIVLINLRRKANLSLREATKLQKRQMTVDYYAKLENGEIQINHDLFTRIKKTLTTRIKINHFKYSDLLRMQQSGSIVEGLDEALDFLNGSERKTRVHTNELGSVSDSIEEERIIREWE